MIKIPDLNPIGSAWFMSWWKPGKMQKWRMGAMNVSRRAFEAFAKAHPVETHDLAPDLFWEYFHREYPGYSRDEMKAMLRECEEKMEASDE